MDTLFDLKDLENELGIKEKFLNDLLLKEDDWSFVIKLHALLESATSHLLTKHFGYENCADIFTRLPMSDKSIGKLAFIKALDLIDQDGRSFIHTLSKVRNDMAHNVAHVEFDLKTYASNLPKDQKRNLVKVLFLAIGHISMKLNKRIERIRIYFYRKLQS